MKGQKEAVYNTVKSVCEEHGRHFEDFTKVDLSKDMKAQCIEILVAGFEAGEIELKSDQENLKSYAGGLLSNWLRKDKRLNGNSKYEPANPGSRTGQSDDYVKNMRVLLATLPEGSDEFNKVQDAIDTRIATIKAEKNASRVKEINADFIPEELQHLITK